MRWPRAEFGCCATEKKYIHNTINNTAYFIIQSHVHCKKTKQDLVKIKNKSSHFQNLTAIPD